MVHTRHILVIQVETDAPQLLDEVHCVAAQEVELAGEHEGRWTVLEVFEAHATRIQLMKINRLSRIIDRVRIK